MSSKNKLFFVGMTPYPNGLAATNRISSLFEGINKNKWEVIVICLSSSKFPTQEKSKKQYERKGTHNTVSFQYLSLFVKAPSIKLLRFISLIFGLFILPFFLLKSKKSTNKNILLTNLSQGQYIIYFKILATFFNFKFLLIRSEYTSLVRNKSKLLFFYKHFIESWVFKLIDGFIFMTESLNSYYYHLIKKQAKTKVIPMTVNFKRFQIETSSPFEFDYIAYAGSLSFEKDGVDILLMSFIKIAEKYKTIHLVIIGDKTKYKINEIENIICNANLEIRQRIHLVGYIDNKLIPMYLNNAKVLTLPRPNSIQAQGGFPSKLGEYLSTGKPVIATKVGEISKYLVNNFNSFLCEPDDVIDFTEKLDWVLDNYDKAIKIGEKGRLLAQNTFSAEVQSKVFENYLNSFE